MFQDESGEELFSLGLWDTVQALSKANGYLTESSKNSFTKSRKACMFRF